MRRVMDGLLPLPAILLALALMAMMRGSVRNVIIALVIPEIPRVIRVVRASVLSLREHAMVEAARALGGGTPRILVLYIRPALLPPRLVQATYMCASAILFEAYLSFLGAGTPPHIPSWGNMMAEGKTYVQLAFWIILFPGLFLALTVLAINLVGDGLRDLLNVRGCEGGFQRWACGGRADGVAHDDRLTDNRRGFAYSPHQEEIDAVQNL